MAYVQPGGRVQYFRNVNLTPDSEDTIYFASRQAKDDYFSSLVNNVLDEQNVTYINGAGNKGVFRSALGMSHLYNVRYLRFRNAESSDTSHFDTKWWYAWVTSVDYANNGMTEVSFEIDDLISWMGDFDLGKCLIVREHVKDDRVYQNYIEEDLPTGDYVLRYEELLKPHYPGANTGGADNTESFPQLVVSIAKEAQDVGAVGAYRGNIISGAEYRHYDISTSGADRLSGDIDDLIDATGGNAINAIISANIVFGSMTPRAMSGTMQGLQPYNYTGVWTGSSHSLGEVQSSDSTKRYMPVNKKLYCYPYCVIDVFNSEGSEQEYRYEWFSDHLPHFYMFGVAADIPEMCIIPHSYRGSQQGYVMDEALFMRQFPQASIAVDQYRAYVAQMTSGGGQYQVLGKIAQTAIGAAASVASGNYVGAAAGALSGGVGIATQLLADKTKYTSMPDAVLGTANSDMMMAINQKCFRILHKSITADYARIIDNFFNAYGYRVNKVDKPSMRNRPAFTYVKTSGCLVKGSLPAQAAKVIADRFDKGLRFWNGSAANIGDLNMSNGQGVLNT